ncbi:protein transport protein Sec24C-like [Biomphalaria glabrata]|uniref:Protein transport protein Sec24C-like n=1 Tax=Biomphalaria glabrata TaxID=6526 RepID=A0A9W2ZLY5_BIOGL|nr:protein transport protein Sec24C-like [Biomphalaria glabrata]XP_055875954.1 protein transport protein Sec24C-like [Biomphalaria glabrata]
MSGQFPYPGGPPMAVPRQNQTAVFNGSLSPGQGYETPNAGKYPPTQNGPYGAPPRPQFPLQGATLGHVGIPSGFPPGHPSQSVGAVPPTSQFNSMSLNDPAIRPVMQPSQMGVASQLPPTPNQMSGPQQRSMGPFPPNSTGPNAGLPPPLSGSHPPPVGGSLPPPLGGGMQPPFTGGLPPSLGGGIQPPTSGVLPPHPVGSMPPPTSGVLPPHPVGNMPSQTSGVLPPHPAGSMQPPTGAVPPHPAGSMPPHNSSGLPLQQSGGMQPPVSGGFPPQQGGMPLPLGGGMPPPKAGIPTYGPPSVPTSSPMAAPIASPGFHPLSSSVPGSLPPVSSQQFPPSSQLPPSGVGQYQGQPPSGGFQGQLPPQSSHQPFQPGAHYNMPSQSMPGQPMHSTQPGGPPPTMGMGGPPPPMGMGGPVNQFPGSSPFQQQSPGYPGQPTQPQQQKRLDPDQMPSPIQVIEDDKKNRSGVYQTNIKGSVPPLVTTPFITQDQGNSGPKFIRSTMYNVPCTADMLKSSHIPFALALTPFAELDPNEQAPPLVDLGELGPVRCKRCKAYMNPFMQFIDGGRRFQCVFCGAATDVPNEYFAHLDHTGRRVDCYNRAELCLGTYEFVATKDYCKNGIPPKEPAFIFMIDVSYNSVKSGLVQLICNQLKSEILVNLPKESGADASEIRVGFVTYHKELHFYNVKSSLAQPQMMVVSDLEDMFVPLIDGFLVKLSESEGVIDSLLSQIPQLFSESKETELVLGPVIQAGLDALRSADRPGRLYIFHTGLPTAEAPGKLKNRDDRKLLGTEKEKTILTPQTQFYSKLGTDCVAAGCSVDLFLFPNQYIDVATMSDICRVTSGNIYKYSYFQADIDGERFIEDLKTSVKRSQGFDAILRVRTSTGIRPVDFYGNFYMANTTDVEMASIDSDSTVCLEVKHDDKLNEAEGAFIQVAVLYTTISGQRRLRCQNLALNCCVQMADLFRSCELDVLINFFAKQAIRTSLNANPKQVREHIMNEVAQILACYRKNCANPSSVGQLVLPECMKLLPLYANCIIKNDSISGGSEISTDDRSYLMHLVNGMDVKLSNVFFYPRLVPFHTLDMDSTDFPTAIRCSVERLEDSGIYILENGLSMFLWVGINVSPDTIQKIFAVQSAAQIDIDKVKILQLDNPVSRRLCDLINRIRHERSRYLKLTIVRQRDKLQSWFDHFLVEDKSMNNGSSYVDFLCHIHKEIRNILN